MEQLKKFTPIPFDALETQLNKPVHLKWADRGCVWILREIIKLPNENEKTGHLVRLETPKTHKKRTANSLDLMYSRENEPKA